MATPKVFSKKKTAQEQYVESLDPLLQRNKGGFTTPGYDVSSNKAYILPDGRAVAQPQGLEGGLALPTYYDSPYTMQQFGVLGARDGNPESYRTDAVSFLRKFYPQEAKPLGTLSDGGVYYSNGIIKYSDGTERQGDPNAYGVASMADGSIRYSDGSVRVVTPQVIYSFGDGRAVYSDGTVRYTAPAQEQGGVNALQSSIFGGQNFPITQAYGNYNPALEPNPEGINYGLDIGANNQTITAPFRGRVVKRLYDDGTRFGSRSKHMGYGNSVLVQLETGEMLRFSHLSGTDLQEGDIIEPGMVIGTTGATGNVTGPHLDLEYYDANGRISNPENLSILQNGGLMEGQILDPNELSDQERQLVQRLQEDYKNPPRSENKPYSEPTQGRVLGSETNLRQEVPQPTQPQGVQLKVGGDLSDTVANVGKAANLPELGASEAVNTAGKVASQAVYEGTQGLEKAGQAFNAPDLMVGEFGRGEYPKPNNAIQYAFNVAQKNNAPDLGLSEVYDKASQNYKTAQNLTANALQSAGDLVRQANPISPKPAMASGEFNQNQPIGDKVNQNLVESNILTALDNIKSTFNINPQKAIDTVGRGVSAVASDAEKGASAIQSGVGNVSESVGNYLNRAKGAISDTFDGESDDNGGDNPIEKAVNSASSVFKKSSGSSSSKSSSKSSSSKSSSKSSNSGGAVKTNSNTIVNTNTGKAYQVPKTSKPMSPVPVASKNINYSPVPKSSSSKPSSKSSNSSVFKKVTSIVKSLFGW